MKTWKQTRDALLAIGVGHGCESYYLDRCRRATARNRHANRVQAVIDAVNAYIDHVHTEHDVPHVWSQPLRHFLAQLLITADWIGIGGPGGLGDHAGKNNATTRHPAFANCGKGRRKATDGPAWTAAIQDAEWHFRDQDICPDVVGLFSPNCVFGALTIRPEPDPKNGAALVVRDIERYPQLGGADVVEQAILLVLGPDWYDMVFLRVALRCVETGECFSPVKPNPDAWTRLSIPCSACDGGYHPEAIAAISRLKSGHRNVLIDVSSGEEADKLAGDFAAVLLPEFPGIEWEKEESSSHTIRNTWVGGRYVSIQCPLAISSGDVA